MIVADIDTPTPLVNVATNDTNLDNESNLTTDKTADYQDNLTGRWYTAGLAQETNRERCVQNIESNCTTVDENQMQARVAEVNGWGTTDPNNVTSLSQNTNPCSIGHTESCESFSRSKCVIKPYQCKHCNKAFTRASNLKTHERIHSGVKPYQCKYCDKAFARGEHLKTHERIHSGVKPYQCKHCDKAFTCGSNLKTHARIHSGVKPYQCKHCDKAFTNGSDLQRHESIHM